MKAMMVLVAAAAAAGTVYWLRSGGDLDEVKTRAKDVMGHAEQETADTANELTPGGGSVPGFAPTGV